MSDHLSQDEVDLTPVKEPTIKTRRRILIKKPKPSPYQFQTVLMPGSGAISFTNYQLTSKSNPYLIGQNIMPARPKTSKRKKDIENVKAKYMEMQRLEQQVDAGMEQSHPQQIDIEI